VLATPSPEEDAATIARADELLRTNPDAYWRDHGLQELALEARERQQAAPPAEPGIDHEEIERRVAQQEVDRFAAMLRQPAEAAKYWASAELQERHHRAIAASIREAPAAVPPVAAPIVAVAPSPPAEAPVAPAPVKVALTDADRRTEIETMMRSGAYWNDAAAQQEYRQILLRQAGEAPLAAETPPAPVGAPAGSERLGARTDGPAATIRNSPSKQKNCAN
jgi:hypothetical protein